MLSEVKMELLQSSFALVHFLIILKYCSKPFFGLEQRINMTGKKKEEEEGRKPAL